MSLWRGGHEPGNSPFNLGLVLDKVPDPGVDLKIRLDWFSRDSLDWMKVSLYLTASPHRDLQQRWRFHVIKLHKTAPSLNWYLKKIKNKTPPFQCQIISPCSSPLVSLSLKFIHSEMFRFSWVWLLSLGRYRGFAAAYLCPPPWMPLPWLSVHEPTAESVWWPRRLCQESEFCSQKIPKIKTGPFYNTVLVFKVIQGPPNWWREGAGALQEFIYYMCIYSHLNFVE